MHIYIYNISIYIYIYIIVNFQHVTLIFKSRDSLFFSVAILHSMSNSHSLSSENTCEEAHV